MTRAGSAICGVAILISTLLTPAKASQGTRYRDPVRSEGGAVATIHPLAGEAAIEILDAGGNAIDAAVAAVFAIGVTRPDMCGIGGGGFLVYRSAAGKTAALDFREMAPLMYTFSTGRPTFGTGHNVVGVPGTVAGMSSALERYGSMSLAEVIAPAEEIARNGFAVTPELSLGMALNANRLRLFPASAKVYLLGGQLPYPPGAILIQEDYADSLALIAGHGPAAFYEGRIARLIAKDMSNSGSYAAEPGTLRRRDLANYLPVWRRPLTTTYRGHEIVAMPPPTSGGIAVIEILNILAGFDLAKAGQSSADHFHYLAEAQKIGWADRNEYVGDPDFVDVPIGRLTSKEYAAKRRKEIEQDSVGSYGPGRFSTSDRPSADNDRTASHTTHVSVVDDDGNAVAVTCTIEQTFGSAVVAPGTGFLLNNQLTDFSGPGTANEPHPLKRPRSSTSPTIVVHKGAPVLVVGGAGGPCIIMGVLQSVVNLVDFGLDIARAVDAERVDARCSGETLRMEDLRVPREVQAELEDRGHAISRQGEYAGGPIVEVVGLDPETNEAMAFSDPRSEWGAAGQ